MESNSVNQISSVKRFFNLLQLDRKDIVYVYLYAIFSGIITLSLPLGIQAIIELIAGGAVSTSLFILIFIVTAATALDGFLKVMQLTVTETIQRKVFIRSAFEFAYRLPRLKLEYTLREYPPELVNRFFDTLTLQKGIPKLLVDFSSAILQIFFGLILICFYHPFFIFFSVVLIIIVVAIFWITGPGGLKTSLKESKYKYQVAYWLEEIARAMTTFKLGGGQDHTMRRTDKLVESYLDSRKSHFRILLIQFGNIVGFKTLVTGTLLVLGSLLVIDNSINIGQFVAAEIIVLTILSSVEKLILSMETIYDVLTAVTKIGSVTDLDLDNEDGIQFSDVDSSNSPIAVSLKSLSFQFNDSGRMALKDINMDIDSGERVCISGYNNSGKSTLIDCIMGFFNSFQGSISYNGLPIKSLDLVSLRKHIGNYSTHEDIFKGSIIENICRGHSYISLEDVIWASKCVRLDEFIKTLEEGYNTQLQPGGLNIPRSIRTKILLARSIVAKPRLLLMEDAYNLLEHEDREAVIEFLTHKDRNWTLIVVSNDPVFAKYCDKVAIMKGGEIVAEGAFETIQNTEHYKYIY